MDESCYINESVLLNYFAGELPADRRKEVEEWIAASEDNEKMARDIFRLYRAADTLDYMNRVDASAALQQVKGRIHKHRHRISWMVWGQRIAACMALPLLATTLYLILKIRRRSMWRYGPIPVWWLRQIYRTVPKSGLTPDLH